MVVPLLYSFIQTHVVLVEDVSGTISDNAGFFTNARSEAVFENVDLIPQSSAQKDQN